MQKIILGIRYGLYMIKFGLQGTFVSINRKFKDENALKDYEHKVIMDWCKFTMRVLKMNLTIEGRENIPNEACCFIGNHQSILDIPILLYSSDRIIGFISKKELLKVPIIGGWIRRTPSVALDRDDIRGAIEVINKGAENLKNGKDMGIFPEGTRSKNGEVGEFKKGSFKLATKAKAIILPYTITGIGEVLGGEGKVVDTEVKIVYHNPIDCSKLSREEIKALPKRVEEIVKSAL